MIDRRWLLDRGFSGFVDVGVLRNDYAGAAPKSPGVYAVLRERTQPPEFLEVNPGGHFKGKDPTVPCALLEQSWVPESQVVYIGKAGRIDAGQSIQHRIRQYLAFGAGKPVGHWGGRLIWQLADSQELIFAWRETPGVDPRAVERELISEFLHETCKLPFANLTK